MMNNNKTHNKPFNMTSIEETIQLARLQQAANSSSLYERKHNQKALKVLTVAAYILFVSMAAIILSFYYVFIWDPTTKSIPTRAAINCDTVKKIVIPESIAIKLTNSSEVSAEYFYQNIYHRFQQIQEQKKIGRRKFAGKEKIASLLESPIDSDHQKKIAEKDQSSSIDSTSQPRLEQSQSTTTVIQDDLSFEVHSKDQVAYVDDEDLGTDYDQSEASGANRLPANETSSIFRFGKNHADN